MNRTMSDNVLVIPATSKVGSQFPPYLPLADGSVKPLAECSREEVAQAVEEFRALARQSRERLQQVYEEHVRDIETLAQVCAYFAKYHEWRAVREGGEVREQLWDVE
jgi:hypothetical protein